MLRIRYTGNLPDDGPDYIPSTEAFTVALFEGASDLTMYYLDLELSKLKMEYREIAGYVACFTGSEEDFIYGAQQLFMSFKRDILGGFELIVRQEPYEEKDYHFPAFAAWRKSCQVEIDPVIPF